MAKSFYELKENDWVQVMTPDATRNHCLIAISGDYAKSYCGRDFNVRDLVGVEKDECKKSCQRCVAKVNQKNSVL